MFHSLDFSKIYWNSFKSVYFKSLFETNVSEMIIKFVNAVILLYRECNKSYVLLDVDEHRQILSRINFQVHFVYEWSRRRKPHALSETITSTRVNWSWQRHTCLCVGTHVKAHAFLNYISWGTVVSFKDARAHAVRANGLRENSTTCSYVKRGRIANRSEKKRGRWW